MTFLRRPWIIAVAAVLALASVAYAWHRNEVREERDAAEAKAKLVAARDSALGLAARQRQRADASAALALQEGQRADSILAAVQVDTLWRTVEEVQAEPVPIDCTAIVAGRDSLLAEARRVTQGLREALEARTAEAVQLRLTVRTLNATLDSLVADVESLPVPAGSDDSGPRLHAVAALGTDGHHQGLTLAISRFEVFGGLCDGRRCLRGAVRVPIW